MQFCALARRPRNELGLILLDAAVVTEAGRGALARLDLAGWSVLVGYTRD
jgi:hypothetical protein